MSWLTEAAPVASAGFAALAAGASWRAVWHARRAWRTTIEPDIHLQVLQYGGTNTTHLVIYNGGGGIAKGAVFSMAGGGQRCHGYLLDGFIRPGDKLLVESNVPADADDTECLVMYRTLDDSSYAVNRMGEKNRMRKGRKGKVMSESEIWTKLFPQTEYESLPVVSSRVRLVDRGGR